MLGGCGGGSSSTATTTTKASGTPATGAGGGTSIDACKLSESQISQVVGFEVKRDTTSAGGSCMFTASGNDGSHVGSSVSVNVNKFDGAGLDLSQLIDGIAKQLNTTAEPATGIGDKAFFIDAGVVFEPVVFKGDQEVTIAIGGLSGDANTRKDQAKKLADLLLG